MDYKINALLNEVELKDVLIEDITDLMFGVTPDGTTVFDATEYCAKAEEGVVFNTSVFMRACRPFVDGYIEIEGLEVTKLFYTNKNGHALINAGMVYLFLAYVSRIWLAYFDSIVSEAIRTGVAYSDSFLFRQIMERVPTGILERIIESRKEDEEQQSAGE